MKNNYALETFMDDVGSCKSENAVRFCARAPNNAVVGLWEFNSLSARLRRVRFPSAAPNNASRWDLCLDSESCNIFQFNSGTEASYYGSDGICVGFQFQIVQWFDSIVARQFIL